MMETNPAWEIYHKIEQLKTSIETPGGREDRKRKGKIKQVITWAAGDKKKKQNSSWWEKEKKKKKKRFVENLLLPRNSFQCG